MLFVPVGLSLPIGLLLYSRIPVIFIYAIGYRGEVVGLRHLFRMSSNVGEVDGSNGAVDFLDPKDDGMVLAQPALEGPVTPLVSSAKDPPLNNAKNPSTQDA
nr:hypothetical protein CFP56_69251 [Quercus suber]